MNWQCDCVVCVLFDRPEVSFNVLRLGQRGPFVFWVPFFFGYNTSNGLVTII